MPSIMDEYDIAFPNLGIYLNNVPKTIHIGSFEIALYGIIIAAGMMLGILMAAYAARKSGENPDDYWDIAFFLLLFSVIGARVYYVVFYWDAYRDNLLQVFNIRGGGLAIYGGVIAGAITVFVFCKAKHRDFVTMVDYVVYGLLVGQILGRWGNFTNREVFGGYTDSLFAMRLPISMVRARDIDANIAAHIEEGTNYIQVHPTFLYESLWNLGLLCILLFLLRRRRFRGETGLIYFGGYGIGRAVIEWVRTDRLYIGNTKIPVSMALGLTLFAVCTVLFIIDLARIGRGTLKVTDYSKVPEYVKAQAGGEDTGNGAA